MDLVIDSDNVTVSLKKAKTPSTLARYLLSIHYLTNRNRIKVVTVYCNGYPVINTFCDRRCTQVLPKMKYIK